MPCMPLRFPAAPIITIESTYTLAYLPQSPLLFLDPTLDLDLALDLGLYLSYCHKH